MKAHELIDSPEKWCRHHFAMNSNGCATDHYDQLAVAFCVMGALHRAYGERQTHAAALGKLRRRISASHIAGVTYWNDHSDWLTVYSTLEDLDI